MVRNSVLETIKLVVFVFPESQEVFIYLQVAVGFSGGDVKRGVLVSFVVALVLLVLVLFIRLFMLVLHRNLNSSIVSPVGSVLAKNVKVQRPYVCCIKRRISAGIEKDSSLVMVFRSLTVVNLLLSDYYLTIVCGCTVIITVLVVGEPNCRDTAIILKGVHYKMLITALLI